MADAAQDGLTLLVVFLFLVLFLLIDLDFDDTAAVLLVVAQSFFMLLPLSGFYAMRAGRPTPASCHKIANHAIAAAGFVTLICMFTVKGSMLGVKLCTINLSLRAMEAMRIWQLHVRHRPQKAVHRF